MSAHAVACYPEEACGLLVGPPGSGGDDIISFEPCTNAAASARVYELDPLEHLRIERRVESEGHEVVGVLHSHTHTEPYPSPTDVAQAPDPGWQYVIVSLKRGEPEVRSYRIVDGNITEARVVPVD
jgi:proteasome lid subunit RPN8/RPN11